MSELKYRIAARIRDRMLNVPDPKLDREVQYEIDQMLRRVLQLRVSMKLLVIAPPKLYKRIEDRVMGCVGSVRYRCNSIKDLHRRYTPSVPALKMSTLDIVKDIDALTEEFGGWKYHQEEAPRLSITTDDISFNGIDLGSFRIELSLETLQYYIVAIDPKYSLDEESCTHPHVMNETLCAGDSKTTLRRLLDTGQIFDFFMQVNTLLHNYRERGAYAPIETWIESSTSCSSCNSRCSEESTSMCVGCEDYICENCGRSCVSCSDIVCDDCTYHASSGSYCSSCYDDLNVCCVCDDRFSDDDITYCNGCDDPVCNSCSCTCEECSDRFCATCVTTTTNLGPQRITRTHVCGQCKEEAEDEHSDDTEVHTVRVG